MPEGSASVPERQMERAPAACDDVILERGCRIVFRRVPRLPAKAGTTFKPCPNVLDSNERNTRTFSTLPD